MSVSPASHTAPETLSPGTVVGGRFRVEAPLHQDALVHVLRATDEKTNRPIALNVLTPHFVRTPDELNLLREEIRLASKLKHRSVVGTYGVGTHGGRSHFVACEWVDGLTLDELVQQRRAADNIISVRGAYNLLVHICKALAAAHEAGVVHGAVRPSKVWVAKDGKVKVGDLGLGLAMVKSGKWALLDRREQSFLAPEVHSGATPGPQADVFGVGTLLYVLLTGRSPDQEFVGPSRAHPDATDAVDAILNRCLSPDPGQRYASPNEIINALLPLVSESPESMRPDADMGIDIEIDVDVAASMHPPAPAQSVARQNAIPAAARLPQPLPSAATAAPVRPALAPSMRNQEPEPEARRSELDIHSLVAEISKDDAPRWIANKEGLDYGPFSGRELVALIVKGDVLEQHALMNLDTGDRRTVREYPEFSEFVQQYKLRKAETDHQEALVKSDKVEKRANVATFSFLAGGIGILLLVGAAYLVTRNKAAEETATADANLAALYESGQVKITGTAGILKHTGGGKGPKRTGGGSSPGGGLSYEDAMNQAVDLGDAKNGGGERQLTSGDVAGVMNTKLNSLFGCVAEEMKRGGRLGNVRIDIAIAGSGSVLGASINTGSAAFQGCIAGKVRNIRFPAFPAPRMGARYSFNVD